MEPLVCVCVWVCVCVGVCVCVFCIDPLSSYGGIFHSFLTRYITNPFQIPLNYFLTNKITCVFINSLIILENISNLSIFC
jgi:hypothetical protein